MGSANSQNCTIHKRMRNTPTRRRNGDMPADFASSVDDPSPMQIPGLHQGGSGLVLYALHSDGATQLPRALTDQLVLSSTGSGSWLIPYRMRRIISSQQRVRHELREVVLRWDGPEWRSAAST